MKKYVNKKNYPLWLLLLAFISAIVFMTTLESTPGSFAFFLSLELFLAVGGFAVTTIVLLARAIRGISAWVSASENKKQKTQRSVGFTFGIIFALPFAYFWFAMLALAYGFMSIAIQQRIDYH